MEEAIDTSLENDETMPFIKRHKKLVVFLIVIAVIAAILLIMPRFMGGAVASLPSEPQTLALARMDLEQIVSGTGTLYSKNSSDVTSSFSYDILEIYVEEGDIVNAGQPLAMLDTADIDKDIADARKNIADAEASDSLALSQAERKLQDAIDTRNINWAKNEQAVQDASDDLKAANKNVEKAKTALDSAAAELKTALASVLLDKSLSSRIKSAGDLEYQYLQSGKPDEDFFEPGYTLDTAMPYLSIYFARFSDAQKNYDSAVSAVSNSAQGVYDRAVETRDSTYRSDSISVQNAQDTVESQKQKDSASSYRTQLNNYLDDKEDCLIKATIPGTVTTIAAEIGKSAGGGMAGNATGAASPASLFTIEDTTRLEITSSIPEYDAVGIKVGMQVSITSDAFDDEEWHGSVKSISTKATDANSNFTVVVEVISPGGQLAIGMSAKFNIVTESKRDVFAVPYDAVGVDTQGQIVVYEYIKPAALEAGGPEPAGRLMRDGENTESAGQAGRPIVVITGMETDYYIEVSGDGLIEGMILLADPEGKNVNADTRGMGGFGFGGGL